MSQPVICFKIRDFGEIKAELYPEKAPKTVENFLSLIDSNFFDGLIFHRVIPGFMIQGGGLNEQMEGKNAKNIPGEFRANGYTANDIKHQRGVLSMARAASPNSASSQFFIMHEDAPHLDGQYAAFGKVTEGMDVVDKIASVRTGSRGYYDDVPRSPVVIDSVTVLSR